MKLNGAHCLSIHCAVLRITLVQLMWHAVGATIYLILKLFATFEVLIGKCIKASLQLSDICEGGMSFELIHSVIHSFTKEQHSVSITDVVKKEVLLNNKLPEVVTLVQQISGLLGKSGNSVSYGQFGDDMRSGRFPAGFEKYIGGSVMGDEFLQLSHVAVDEMVLQASEVTFATGGLVLVSHYLVDEVPFFLVAMIKQKGGVTLDKDYVPIAIEEIDLTKVHQAARINVSRFCEVASSLSDTSERVPDIESGEGEGEDLDLTYLCFLGTQKSGGASEYFISALGCTKGIASSRATGNAFRGVERFFKNIIELKSYKSKARDAVVDYLKECIEFERNAKLDEICHAALSVLPATLVESGGGLKEFLNGEGGRVPLQFPVHGSTLNKRIRIKGGGAGWAVQFEQQILGVSSNSVMCYDSNSKSLTIRSLPAELIKSIESELSNRN